MKYLLTILSLTFFGLQGIAQCNLDITGSILTPQLEGISDVNVSLITSNGNTHDLSVSGLNTTIVESTDDFTFLFAIEKDINPLNGVSTLDYVLTWRHIIGLFPFSETWEVLAADVDGNGNVTVMDMIHMRRLILGQTQNFEFVPSWQFYDDQYGVHNYTVTVENCAVVGGPADFNFIGVKMGDVNDSKTP